MTKDPNYEVPDELQDPLSYDAGSSDVQVAQELGLGNGDFKDDESMQGPDPHLFLGGSSNEDAVEQLEDPTLPPIMAPPVEPPHDSQVLDDTLVENTQLQDGDYPDPSPSPPKAMQAELPEATVPGEGDQASGSASESIAATELEPSPSPLPAHTSEKLQKDVIEILESPNKKELHFEEVESRIESLKYLICTTKIKFPTMACPPALFGQLMYPF